MATFIRCGDRVIVNLEHVVYAAELVDPSTEKTVLRLYLDQAPVDGIYNWIDVTDIEEFWNRVRLAGSVVKK